MAKRKRMSRCEAKEWLRLQGIPFDDNFFALSSSQVGLVLEAVKKSGYRKRRDAPGSTARMYYQYLGRAKC